MKKLLIIIIILLVSLPALATDEDVINVVVGIAPDVGGGPSYLVSEDFEGTGTPAGWTASGSPDFDYTTVHLSGAQSLYLGTNDQGAYTTFTSGSSTYVRIMYQFAANPTPSSAFFLELRNGTTPLASVRIQNNGRLLVTSGGQEDYGSASTQLSTATPYYIWLEYTKGTGSDSICRVYFSATSTKPETTELEITNGNGTMDANRVQLITNNNLQGVYDDVLVDDMIIGSGN